MTACLAQVLAPGSLCELVLLHQHCSGLGLHWGGMERLAAAALQGRAGFLLPGSSKLLLSGNTVLSSAAERPNTATSPMGKSTG